MCNGKGSRVRLFSSCSYFDTPQLAAGSFILFDNVVSDEFVLIGDAHVFNVDHSDRNDCQREADKKPEDPSDA